MRTTVDLDQHLLKRLRVEARRRGVTVKELLGDLLRRGLDERAGALGERFQCPAFAMGAPAAGVNWNKPLALAAAIEDDETLRELALRK